MEHVINKIGHRIYSNNNHHGYIVKWELIKPFCKKWSRNRDSDATRVEEMIEYFHQGGYIPLYLHLAEVKEEGLVCYDGNHRREVLNSLNVDSDVSCVIDVMFNASQNDVYASFLNLNKSIQVPAIYVDDSRSSSLVKDKILELVKSYETAYRPMVSASARCRAPNFNRDAFTDNIFDIYTHLNGLYSISQIAQILDLLNQEYSKGNICDPHDMFRPGVVEKCRKHNLWLFMQKKIPVEHVKLLIKSTVI